jgi:hypothetical protein
MLHYRLFTLLLPGTMSIAACGGESRSLADTSRTFAPTGTTRVTFDSAVNLLDPKVPRAIAGDVQWKYVQRAKADFDGDGRDETAVLIADVALDARGRPLWEDGHRWQLYFEEADSTRTYIYARFLPFGRLEASVTVPDEEKMPTVVLRELTPHTLGVYEVRYSGPRQSWSIRHLHRELDPRKGFATGR